MPQNKIDAFTIADLFDQEAVKAQGREPTDIPGTVATVVQQARAAAPDMWRDEVRAVQSQVKLRLDVVQMRDPLFPDKLDDPTLAAKVACYRNAIAQLEAAITADPAP